MEVKQSRGKNARERENWRSQNNLEARRIVGK
jgi:hypothetical protein